MDTSEKTAEQEAPEDGADLEQRNQELDQHIDDAERAVERRRSVMREAGAGDAKDLDDDQGGEDPKGAADRS